MCDSPCSKRGRPRGSSSFEQLQRDAAFRALSSAMPQLWDHDFRCAQIAISLTDPSAELIDLGDELDIRPSEPPRAQKLRVGEDGCTEHKDKLNGIARKTLMRFRKNVGKYREFVPQINEFIWVYADTRNLISILRTDNLHVASFFGCKLLRSGWPSRVISNFVTYSDFHHGGLSNDADVAMLGAETARVAREAREAIPELVTLPANRTS
jgi:hypothetical protein